LEVGAEIVADLPALERRREHTVVRRREPDMQERRGDQQEGGDDWQADEQRRRMTVTAVAPNGLSSDAGRSNAGADWSGVR
jgi:hypothetical protein